MQLLKLSITLFTLLSLVAVIFAGVLDSDENHSKNSDENDCKDADENDCEASDENDSEECFETCIDECGEKFLTSANIDSSLSSEEFRSAYIENKDSRHCAYKCYSQCEKEPDEFFSRLSEVELESVAKKRIIFVDESDENDNEACLDTCDNECSDWYSSLIYSLDSSLSNDGYNGALIVWKQCIYRCYSHCGKEPVLKDVSKNS